MKKRRGTYGSAAETGRRALPLNESVISLIDVGSVRWRTTFPLRRAGLTSTPVPLRQSVSEATWISRWGCLSDFLSGMSWYC